MKQELLSTRDAAEILGVGTTTIKRWADEGLLRCARTEGKHRRFEPVELERLRQRQQLDHAFGARPDSADLEKRWIDLLLEGGAAHRLQALLLEERARLGSWWRVADAVGAVLTRVGELWAAGAISVGQEHLASSALQRALSAVASALPQSPSAPRALLGAAEGELHTLGLHLAELCLREAGWDSRWLGGFTPAAELERAIAPLAPRLVVVSASRWSSDAAALAAQHDRLAATCRARGAALAVGGQGAWPEAPAYGARLRSFAELSAYLATLQR